MQFPKIIPAHPGWAVFTIALESEMGIWHERLEATEVVAWCVTLDGADQLEHELRAEMHRYVPYLVSGQPMVWDWDAWPEPKLIVRTIGRSQTPFGHSEYRLARATPDTHPDWTWVSGVATDPRIQIDNFRSTVEDELGHPLG